MKGTTLYSELDHGVLSIVLSRADEYNTITPALRDELSAALDRANADNAARAIVLRAEGPAFCAGYGLDWATEQQGQEMDTERVWDSTKDLRDISTFVDVYMKLWQSRKPTISAVQGWCIGGGTDMARLPTNQLVMLKLLCNQVAENMGLASSRTLGSLLDGIARHTPEGLDFVRLAKEVGFREAVRRRDDPFGDYGSRHK